MLAGSINTNVSALFALNSLSNTSNQTNTLEQELSSGLSINSPADNPAGFIAAQGFQTQIGGVTQATSNANEAVSLVQTADGAVQQQINLLQQIRTIADQAANGINSNAELASLQQVVSQLQTQVTTIANQTQFNNLNLLDGSFQGVQFQTGPNAGETIQLSISNTAATNIGAYQSTASAAGGSVYKAGGSATGGVADNTGNSYAITSGGAGAFTAHAIGVSGSAGSATFTVTAGSESAADVAASINAATSSTNVNATANTSVAFTVTSGSFTFTLGNGTGAAQTNPTTISATVTGVTASGLSPLVQAINAETSATGVVATVNSANQLVLNQSAGDNISVAGFAGTGTLAAGGTSAVTLGTGVGDVASATVQGVVNFQSTQSFALDAANIADIGLTANSALSTVSGVNVSTTAGANAALNVIDYAIQSLENVGGGLGATQQQLQATVSNLQTTESNLTTAQGVVQDANIPQVTTKLTQEQILQQAGVSALAQSATLQQSFLKLLQ
jgi:flagellin